jgi:hypothetical protein
VLSRLSSFVIFKELRKLGSHEAELQRLDEATQNQKVGGFYRFKTWHAIRLTRQPGLNASQFRGGSPCLAEAFRAICNRFAGTRGR